MQPTTPPPQTASMEEKEQRGIAEGKDKVVLQIAANEYHDLQAHGEVICSSSEGYIKHLSVNDQAVINDGIRSLAFNKLPTGEYKLELNRRDCSGQFSEWNRIPLGFVSSIDNNEDVDRASCILVPLVPQTFSNEKLLKQECEPLRNGWVYIYVNGYLWREFQSVSNTQSFKEVNLTDHKGKDKRRATTDQAVYELLVPFMMDGEKAEVQVAFSEVQWSWYQIEALGGLNPNDPRLTRGISLNVNLFPDKNDALRNERMVMLNSLGDYTCSFSNSSNDSFITNFNSHHHIAISPSANPGVVMLPDPIGIAIDKAEACMHSFSMTRGL